MEKVITKIYCPLCGEEMMADIHDPIDGAKWRTPPGPPKHKPGDLRYMDNWICNSGDRLTCKVTKETIFFDRDDIEEWLE